MSDWLNCTLFCELAGNGDDGKPERKIFPTPQCHYSHASGYL